MIFAMISASSAIRTFTKNAIITFSFARIEPGLCNISSRFHKITLSDF